MILDAPVELISEFKLKHSCVEPDMINFSLIHVSNIFSDVLKIDADEDEN